MSFQNSYKIKGRYGQHPDFNLKYFSGIIEGLPELMISENDNAYFVRAFMSGVSVEDFKLRFIDRLLELEVTYTSPSGRYLFQERAVGTFLRKVEFNSSIDGSEIQSELENGLLFIELPKSKVKEIEIVTDELGASNARELELHENKDMQERKKAKEKKHANKSKR